MLVDVPANHVEMLLTGIACAGSAVGNQSDRIIVDMEFDDSLRFAQATKHPWDSDTT
ncbi:MAG: hypothetical protein ACFWT0_01920 [Bifidobacterium crudilactis]